MKLKHLVYPSPLVYTSEGKAKFSDYHFETKNKKLAEALRAQDDIVEVKPPRKTPSATTQED